jgi:hypothetical protein
LGTILVTLDSTNIDNTTIGSSMGSMNTGILGYRRQGEQLRWSVLEFEFRVRGMILGLVFLFLGLFWVFLKSVLDGLY